MKVDIKAKLKLITLCVGLASASVAVAAGFGVSGSQSEGMNESAISHLLTDNQSEFVGNKSQLPSNASSIQNENQAANAQNNQSAQGSSNRSSQNGNRVLGNSGVSQAAFSETVHNLLPLTPQQIKVLHYLFNKSQQAASESPGTPPRPTSTTVSVNLSPGGTPPVIRLRAGYVTSLVFLDSTGQPWPIVAYDLGNPKAFNVEPNQPNGKSDTLLVEALDTYKQGNIAVMLKGQNTPIMITLMPGQRAVDYRVDLRVPGLGPNAKPNLSGLPSTGNPQLINFLDGVPPQGATAIQVSGGQGEAWTYQGKLFLRTQLTVVSPSWLSTMSSPDGTHVYELTKTPVVLASEQGTIVQLTMRGL